MTDSAKDFSAEEMTLPSAPSMHSVKSLGLESVPEPDTPTSSRAMPEVQKRSGFGKLFRNTFRRTSIANKQQRWACLPHHALCIEHNRLQIPDHAGIVFGTPRAGLAQSWQIVKRFRAKGGPKASLQRIHA